MNNTSAVAVMIHALSPVSTAAWAEKGSIIAKTAVTIFKPDLKNISNLFAKILITSPYTG